MESNIDKISFSSFSLTDSFGRVFFIKDKVYRAINPIYENECRDFLESDLFSELDRRGYIPKTSIAKISIEGYNLILEHERLLEVYPYEWSFSMYKKSALFILELLQLCNSFNYELKDAHLFNILFRGNQPVFVDFGSIVKSNSPYWIAHKEFISDVFIPLKIWSEGDLFTLRRLIETDYPNVRFLPTMGIFNSKLFKKYTHSISWGIFIKLKKYDKLLICTRYNHILHIISYFVKKILKVMNSDYGITYLPYTSITKLSNTLTKIERKRSSSMWQDYHTFSQMDDKNSEEYLRLARIVHIVSNLPNVDSVLDLAGNQGLISFAIKEERPNYKVITADYDENALDDAYNITCKRNIEISTVLLNFMLPVSSDVSERLKSSIVLALAVTHHLILTQGYNIDAIFQQIKKFSRKYILIEFMPLGLWAKGGALPDIPDWYNIDWFKRHIKLAGLKICAEEKLEVNRILFVLEIENL